MKNPPLQVGVINAPDDHYNPVLYSHAKASKAFNQLDHDIYYSVQQNKGSYNDKKTPKSVFVAIGLGIAAICYPIIKKIFKH